MLFRSNNIQQVFDDAHIRERGMQVAIPHPRAAAGAVPALANPAKLAKTPPAYERPAPLLGEHTQEVLRDVLGLSDDDIQRLVDDKVV